MCAHFWPVLFLTIRASRAKSTLLSSPDARLVSGEETAVGMIPPSYEDVLGGINHSGTITRTRDASRSMSRDPRSASRDVGRPTSRSRSRAGLVTGNSSRSASPMPALSSR